MHLRSALDTGAAAAVLPVCAAALAIGGTAPAPPADREPAAAAGEHGAAAPPGAGFRAAASAAADPVAGGRWGRRRRPARCGNPAAAAFPLRSRLHGGPTAYRPGGARHTVTLELANPGAADCRSVHPLVVLVARAGRLAPRQIRLVFRDPASGAWRPVGFETSDENEIIGLPGGEDGPGYTVPAHGVLDVPLRLGFTADARPDRVVVSATTMQRRGRRGAWVGESDHYAFDIRGGRGELAWTGRHTVVLLVLAGLSGLLTVSGAVLFAVAGLRRRTPR